MLLRAWRDDGALTTIVQIGDDMYEMSDDANMPNGVCIYQGTAADLAWTVRDKPRLDLPLGMIKKIIQIAKPGESLEEWRNR